MPSIFLAFELLRVVIVANVDHLGLSAERRSRPLRFRFDRKPTATRLNRLLIMGASGRSVGNSNFVSGIVFGAPAPERNAKLTNFDGLHLVTQVVDELIDPSASAIAIGEILDLADGRFGDVCGSHFAVWIPRGEQISSFVDALLVDSFG